MRPSQTRQLSPLTQRKRMQEIPAHLSQGLCILYLSHDAACWVVTFVSSEDSWAHLFILSLCPSDSSQRERKKRYNENNRQRVALRVFPQGWNWKGKTSVFSLRATEIRPAIAALSLSNCFLGGEVTIKKSSANVLVPFRAYSNWEINL